MRYFAIHRMNGDIVTLATCGPEAPPVAMVGDPGEVVTEIEVPEGAIQMASPAGPGSEQSVLEVLRAFQIVGGKLARKSSP